jgi:hypothetical protein
MTTRTFVVLNGKRTIEKDPNDNLDYIADWTDWLLASAGDLLQSVVWAITGDDILLVKENQSIDVTNKLAQIQLSGGTVGKKYGVTCRITTAGGRIKDDTFYVKVKEQ